MPERRVCIIGNSHVAAWKAGMDLVPEWRKEFDTEYFASQSDLMRHIELRDNVLVPTSELTRRRMKVVSGEKTDISIGDYSHFVVIGLGLNTVEPVETLREFRLPPFQLVAAEGAPVLSKAAFAALVESLARNSTAAHIAGLVRKVTDAPIVIVPQPYPSEAVRGVTYWKRLDDSGVLTHAAELFRTYAAAVADGLRCQLLMQPASTVVRGHFTRNTYSTGSIRLARDNVEHPETEPFHMNADFGAEMLRTCLRRLREAR
jgi:hypothetical protein